jgi:hypothetical protein
VPALAAAEGVVDQLAADVEPYSWFRWLLAIVLSAMAFHSLLVTFFFLRDLAGEVRERSPREEQLARILKLWGKLLLLRAFSLRMARANLGLIAQIAALGAAAIALNVWIFARGG